LLLCSLREQNCGERKLDGMTIQETLEYHALRRLAHGSVSTQRTLAESLGISLGKTNALVRALVARRLVAVVTVRGNPGRTTAVYRLTPKGIVMKATLTHRVLLWKMKEYDQLQKEIDALACEAGAPDIRSLAG